MMNLPKRNEIVTETESIRASYRSKTNTLILSIKESESINYNDILEFLNIYRNANLTIDNINSRSILNSVLDILKGVNYNGTITVNLINTCNLYPEAQVSDLYKGDYISIENLPRFIKIKGFKLNNSQTDFTIWAHNLNYMDKNTLLTVLTDQDRKLFINQANTIVYFYRDLTHKLALNGTIREEKVELMWEHLNNMPETKRFEFLFNYVSRNYVYAYEATTRDGSNVNPNDSWSQDAIETYNRGRGVCEGRANLLTLIANNHNAKLNCTTMTGILPSGVEHVWNNFVDENGVAYHYDLPPMGLKFPIRELRGRTIKDVSSYVLKAMERPSLPPRRVSEVPMFRPSLPPRSNKGNEPKAKVSVPLPPRKKTFTPLPPRREDK